MTLCNEYGMINTGMPFFG